MAISRVAAFFATLFNILFGTLFNTIFSMHGFFRLANFGVFIVLVVYLYRRYVKPFITSQIKVEESVFEGLMMEQRDAMKLHDTYAQQVARTVQQQTHLQRMIVQWNAAVDSERAALALEKSSQLLARKQKAELVAQQLRKLVIAKRVMPEAVAAARGQLKDMFADGQGTKMVQHIISHLADHTDKGKS